MKRLLSTFLCAALFATCISCDIADEKKEERTQNSWETSSLPGDYKLNNEFWDNASVYFVITDRFYNGNEANDTSYGREKGNPTLKADAGKFYGGDIAGLTAKLDYLKDLGINAIWLTAPYEQIHGTQYNSYRSYADYPGIHYGCRCTAQECGG